MLWPQEPLILLKIIEDSKKLLLVFDMLEITREKR